MLINKLDNFYSSIALLALSHTTPGVNLFTPVISTISVNMLGAMSMAGSML